MGRRIGADLVETRTVVINAVASQILRTFMFLTLVAIPTLVICVAATEVFSSLVATNGMSGWAVVINAAS